MHIKKTTITLGILSLLVILFSGNGMGDSTAESVGFSKGNCAGCLLNPKEGLFSFVASTGADYDSLVASCFPARIREELLPPRPGSEEVLVYVALEGGGCSGCRGDG